MSEFSALGVDLNGNEHCGSPEALAKFNSAKAKYSEIRALADAYNLAPKYDAFLSSNGQWIISSCLGFTTK